jgi:hypothetical protein
MIDQSIFIKTVAAFIVSEFPLTRPSDTLSPNNTVVGGEGRGEGADIA